MFIEWEHATINCRAPVHIIIIPYKERRSSYGLCSYKQIWKGIIKRVILTNNLSMFNVKTILL